MNAAGRAPAPAMGQPMHDVRRIVGEINDLLCSVNLLTWDARTQMPPRGATARGRQLSTLSKVAKERLLSPELRRALAEARAAGPDADAEAELDQVATAVETLGRVPDGLLEQLAQHRASSQEAWEDAKRANDFTVFAPALQTMVELNRELAHALGFDEHPYDALVGLYEPGMSTARLEHLFAALREGLLPLLDRIRGQAELPPPAFLSKDYPPERQREAALHFAELVGYDTARGRLDPSAHPFEISFTRDDVRITTRYRRDYLPTSLFGTLHEAGHALYEQGVDSAYARTAFTTDFLGLYAVAGASYGTHESQSRLWENLVGRSLPFWRAHLAGLEAIFPEQLAGTDADAFYRGVNRVAPSLIRVEADEVTYNLHIMLRVEIEAALIDGTLAVTEVPEVWREKVATYLDLEVPDDRRGALQDIHWSAGLIGSFPTYTIGNIMSAQWLEAAKARDPEVAPALEHGDTAPLRAWLTENVYRHGRRFTPDELLERGTGSALSSAPYLDYVRGKYSELYAL